MTQTGPREISLPSGGKAVQWRQLGDHPKVGRPLAYSPKQRCAECGELSAHHGILFGREPVGVCPGDYIVSSPSGGHITKIDRKLLESIFGPGDHPAPEIEPEPSGVEIKAKMEASAAMDRMMDNAINNPTARSARAEALQDAYFYGAGWVRVKPQSVFDPRTDLPTPTTLKDAIEERNHWCDCAMQHLRNEEFYHSIVIQIGEMFGEAARTSDDGSVQQDILALKVPELVLMELGVLEANAAEIDRLNNELAKKPDGQALGDLKAENLRLRRWLVEKEVAIRELRAMGDRIEAAIDDLARKQQARAN